MSTQVQAELLTSALSTLLEETFENVHGYYLYKGTSLLKTLATISAEEASVPVGGGCPTLAAQVKHTAFYLEVIERGIRSGVEERVDWEEIWNTTSAVTPEEWEAIKTRLRDAYATIRTLLAGPSAWLNEEYLENAIATVVHSAYHLGVIRQALCILKP